MSVTRGTDGFYRSSLLDEEPWLEHAFGTAQAVHARPYLTLKQIHSTRVVTLDEWHEGVQADGLISQTAAVTLAVKTADCVPVLIADSRNRAVAAVHAGWRGTAGGIAAAAVVTLQREHGSDPGELLVALGPSIQQCCFEVGAEVGVLFRQIFPERNNWQDGDHIDLQEANRRVLLRAGVRRSNISSATACTCCGGPEFHSWRRDRTIGCRMYSTIAIKG